MLCSCYTTGDHVVCRVFHLSLSPEVTLVTLVILVPLVPLVTLVTQTHAILVHSYEAIAHLCPTAIANRSRGSCSEVSIRVPKFDVSISVNTATLHTNPSDLGLRPYRLKSEGKPISTLKCCKICTIQGAVKRPINRCARRGSARAAITCAAAAEAPDATVG